LFSGSHSQPQVVPTPGRWHFRFLLAALCVALALPAEAYIGPGAGVALVGSFMVILGTLVLAFLVILALPFRILWRAIRYRRKEKPWVRRVIIVGLDGQEPKLTDQYLKEGKLPNFAKLAEQGGYHRLASTFPSISPVAWSSFSTGSHPAKHNIYDFLARDPKTYLPLISSTKIGSVEKFLKIGKWKIPLERPELRLLRRSKPFWTILGEHHIWTTVLRVPITFPPDRFYGAELSAMCVPDLLGTQGTFLFYTTRVSNDEFKEGGERFVLERNGSNRFEAKFPGPPNTFIEGDPQMEVPFVLEVETAEKRGRVILGKETYELAEGVLSDWVTLSFSAGPGIKVKGIVRMQLTEAGEEISLYVTPISLDPDDPAMPVSHPSYYATYLAKKIGPFSTLGLAEDTWALNEGVVDDATFLQQTLDIDAEREKMFFAALDRLNSGTLTCVFDATDRIQHMFWRYIEDGHPAAVGKEDAEHKNAIEDHYIRNDALVGRVMEKMNKDDVLMVISDHGFASFRRGINLNAWLLAEGYLKLKDGADGSSEWFGDVDWAGTKAYCLGLTGMYLNVKGRESQGIVESGKEADALKTELIEKLNGFRDEEKDEVGITEMFDTRKLYTGPYIGNAPDMLIGYNSGYRISWDGATGMASGPVFEDNVKAWSGDHGIDPRQVPGVLFTNHDIDAPDPALIDIAPTTLRLFGIDPPVQMDGKELYTDAAKFAGKGK
jgi:predicted AlkP superfamily phosphohydrolase/phosphomutase